MHHQRSTGDDVSASAAVGGISKGKHGFFPKYYRCQLVCCNLLFSRLLNVCMLAWLFAGYAKNINIVNNIKAVAVTK